MDSVYSKLLYWTVQNFMSIERAKCEFSDSGIINIKGYNDSGKSAMLRALEVLFYNIRPNSQLNFIKDGTDYFRITACFADGVTILRDKYANGQSLYEMYKGNELIYSTKVNGVLSKISSVPEPIEKYLGLLSYDGMMLNSRSCFEKQLLVQTSGGENYKLLNSVLKSEELAMASDFLNTDKNKLSSDIADATRMVTAYKELLEGYGQFSAELLSSMDDLDHDIDRLTESKKSLSTISGVHNAISSIHIAPEIGLLDVDGRASGISALCSVKEQIASLKIPPEVATLNTDRYELLSRLNSYKDSLSSIDVPPSVPTVDCTRYEEVAKISNLKTSLDSYLEIPAVSTILDDRYLAIYELNHKLEVLNHIDSQIKLCDDELAKVETESKSLVTATGGRFIQCPNCGEVIEAGVEHYEG